MSDILENLSPAEILGLTIIGEARGERIEGQVGVGSVVRNRMVSNPARYKNLRDVCLESKQFSCWNSNDPNRAFLVDLAEKLIAGQVITDRYLVQCMYVAKGIESWAIMDNTRGALNYMTIELFVSDDKPSWAKDTRNEHPIGNQIFFNT